MALDAILPSELWVTILSYLDYKDVVSCSRVSTVFNEVCKDSSLWRHICNRYCPGDDCPPGRQWIEHFISWYQDYGRYINCYRQLKKAWDDLEQFIQSHCPWLAGAIGPGVSEEDLNRLELKLGCKFPNDLRCLYRIHDTNFPTRSEFFGCVMVYEHCRSMKFIKLDHASMVQYPFYKERLPLIWCPDSDYHEFIMLKDVDGLSKDCVYVMSNNNLYDLYISANSVTSWFTNYVDSLVKGAFAISELRILRFYHEPGCVQKTQSIEVSAATVFMPEMSSISDQRFVHSYRITLTMDKGARDSESCRLLTRHWIITDENGDEERVNGDGVIGEFPILRPGVSYSWASLTSFKTTYGSMGGHFGMVNLKTGVRFELECPVFHMKCLPYLRSVIYPQSWR